MINTKKWRFAVDRGGTFTDVIGLDPAGQFHSRKLLSHSSAYEDSSIEGIRRMLALEPEELLPEEKIAGIRFGTTVATNALLERKGGKTVLIITKGFRDLLEIGYQDRPDIFQLCIKKFLSLYSEVIEVDERVDARGRKVRECDVQTLSMRIEKLKNENIDAVAVVLMHSWINPAHELLCEKALQDSGFSNIFLSHRTANLIKIVSRGQSTIVDAYLSAVLSLYMKGIQKATGGIPVEFMQSSGALSDGRFFLGKNALLSGPAGGVVAVARISEDRELKGAIGFDMGGTSTDVCRYEGGFQKKYEQTIAGIPLQVETMDIVTVAAGGGSILNFDGQKMTAGPESAGASPGPACYGFGGTLAVTDANLITGRIIPEYFPDIFGTDGKSPLDTGIVKEKFIQLADAINRAMGTSYSSEETANAFLRVANEKMAMAIKEISVSRGFDIRDYALVCFGGAGGQHACSIAALLDIDTIIIHPLSSLMSAYGIGLSNPALKSVRSVLKVFDRKMYEGLASIFRQMEEQLLTDRKKGITYETKREIDIRPEGTDTFLTLEYQEFAALVKTFKEQYKRLFGFNVEAVSLEVVNVRVEIIESETFFIPFKSGEMSCSSMPAPESYRDVYYSDGPVKAGVYRRSSLPAFAEIKGPSVIIDSSFTAVVDPGFKADIDEDGTIIIKRTSAIKKDTSAVSSGRPDPMLLEVFNNLFMGIAAEMGSTLRNTAYSVNMKERLDFSCAVFDSEGNLVANAPHIPVHLGSMADTVKAVVEAKGGTMVRGDVFLTNNPYRGGSHLPDMTVICPVFSGEGRLIFFTASRGHHSDVGGTTPGSMPPSAMHIDEEGVLVDNFLLVRDGNFREGELKDILSRHTYPARNIPERIADFKSQIAACRKGMSELLLIIERYGLQTVLDYMGHIQDNSEYSVKAALFRFVKDNGFFHSAFEDRLDDGTPVKASVTIKGGSNPPETVRAVIDFSGTGEQHFHDNLNAPSSVTRSAVLYVLRSLINRDIPLNSGCLKPVEIIIPDGSIMNPVYPAPVASGNVETSQRIVDVLLGAFGTAAASQGTMNNFLFEVEGETPYYETIAGGAGAMQDCPGASGVQVHMTNTRMTDPEVLEFRHPGVRIEQFTLRKGSGGKGLFPGGEGVVREMKFLKPAIVSIISERRSVGPYGTQGGEAGKKGENIHKKASGEIRGLKHREALKIDEGDSIIIRTPGGGGYGKDS
jgi:5-oxoprolinase (ATP-hydrolysing)